jgi:imidazolonepropionase-like amidohydrolase
MMNTTIVLQQGRVIDPVNNRDAIGDVWIRDGKIIAIESAVPEDAEVHDLRGKWIVPD